MKSTFSFIALFVLAFAGIGNAFAYHGGHVGVYIGGPVFAPWYYPAPYYAPPYYPYAVERAAPPVYVEQPYGAAPAVAPAPNYWYYCRSAKAYYPYVKDCPAGWERVSPQPDQR